MSREVSLVRAELVDALRDYVNVFREKAEMEIRRAEAVEIIAAKVEAGVAVTQPDVERSNQ